MHVSSQKWDEEQDCLCYSVSSHSAEHCYIYPVKQDWGQGQMQWQIWTPLLNINKFNFLNLNEHRVIEHCTPMHTCFHCWGVYTHSTHKLTLYIWKIWNQWFQVLPFHLLPLILFSYSSVGSESFIMLTPGSNLSFLKWHLFHLCFLHSLI